MTDLEGRLRAELAAFARRADPARIRPLGQPAVRAGLRAPGWLAPAAAAAAVAATLMAVTLAGQMAGHRPAAGRGGRAGNPFGPAAGPAAGLPRYYLTLDGPWSWPRSVRAVVHSSATGAALATRRIGLPVIGGLSVTGSADDRAFLILDATDGLSAADGTRGNRLYRLRAGPDGRTVQLARLPVKIGSMAVDGIALSPDGSTVAIAGQSYPQNQIQVSSLATGATKTWHTRAPGIASHLSWSAGGHQLGFLWEANLHSPPPRQQDGYRLLDVAGPGGDLLAAGPVIPVPANPGGDIPPAFVTPDGRAFITSSTRVVPGPGHQVTVTTKIIKLSARNGRVQRVLYAASAAGVPQTYGNAGTLAEQGCQVLSLDPAGRHPLIQCFLLGWFRFGTLASGHLKPLPGIADIYCARHCRGPQWATAAW